MGRTGTMHNKVTRKKRKKRLVEIESFVLFVKIKLELEKIEPIKGFILN